MLSITQSIIERSVFQLINQTLANEGYWPLYDASLYPNTPLGLAAWDTAVKAVITSKHFAAQPFGYGAPQSKNDKQVPRIAIITRRFNPGDIGNPVDGMVIVSPTDPNIYQEIVRPQETLDQQIEVHVVANNSEQERILTAVVYEALGSKGYVPFYGRPGLFFIRQFNYYDLPDPQDSFIEKVYCYEIKDLYIKNDTILNADLPLITRIELQTILGKYEPTIDISILPPNTQDDGTIIIDLSKILYNGP